jgi:chromosome segregation ATPase/CheY-like chemotaxis protein
MTNRLDSSSPHAPSPSTSDPPSTAENVAAEDLGCLRSALDEWQHERERRLTRSKAVEADVNAKLQHAELRLHQAISQLEATKRSAHAVRVRLEADVQAARVRAQQAQEALGATQVVSEQLRITNAELSTALDAAQWRLSELEAESNAHRESLLQMERERHADQQHLTELAHTISQQQQAAAALAALQDSVNALHAEREHLIGTLNEAHDQRADEDRERVALQQRLGELEAARTALCERGTVLQDELAELREAHQQACTAAERELAALRSQLDEQLAAAHAEREEVEARHQSERDTLAARLQSLEEALHDRDARIAQLREVDDELQRLRAEHTDELNAWHDAAAQREAELVASRNGLARELADQQAVTRNARDDAAAMATRVESLVASLQSIHQEREQLDRQLAAAYADSAQIEERHQGERVLLEQELERTRVAHAEALSVWQTHAAQQRVDHEALARRATLLEGELQERDTLIQQTRAELAEVAGRQTQALATAAQAGRQREEEWRASHRALQAELDTTRRNLAGAEGEWAAARQRGDSLSQQLEDRAIELDEIRKQAEAAATLAQQNSDAREVVEQRAIELQNQCNAQEQELQELRKQSALMQQRRDAMAGQIAELENDHSALTLRVDELTALAGQLERECERLRRDRGSSEETRRLKADNARLEAKIVELDRQRTEAVQRHSAAVAGYMVELNQRSEALHAREVELQKLNEELLLVKQSCEDAMSELAAQRHEQGALERRLAELRATPRPTSTPVAVEPSQATAAAPQRPSPAPPSLARASVSKPVKRSVQEDSLTGPITVIHLDENKALCEAAREVVVPLPGSRYLNALDEAARNAPGSRLLAVNLLSRTHDPVEAIVSFIAADTYHQNVLAYCTDGANGFSFGMADFFTQPIDPDACVARLLESRGAIQRLLVVTENFGVVGALRGVLSRMRSSVSAALDLRQVIDLLPMVEPDVILIDLALPRGEGLRLVGRLRTDPKTREVPLGILLAAPGNVAEFRQHVLRAARDLPMTAGHLAETLRQRLGAQSSSDAPRHLHQQSEAALA